MNIPPALNLPEDGHIGVHKERQDKNNFNAFFFHVLKHSFLAQALLQSAIQQSNAYSWIYHLC